MSPDKLTNYLKYNKATNNAKYCNINDSRSSDIKIRLYNRSLVKPEYYSASPLASERNTLVNFHLKPKAKHSTFLPIHF